MQIQQVSGHGGIQQEGHSKAKQKHNTPSVDHNVISHAAEQEHLLFEHE